ncbi:MAG: type II CAAX endopeptidase family protein [Candidatus Omnitrophica bacterium]|nr:type II CAAX endopeptidase family protein [Candidatus Omnitrophota bacterium]
MDKFINFIRKERLYILIFIFVLLFNAVILSRGGNKVKMGLQVTTRAPAFEDQEIKKREMEKLLAKNEGLSMIFGLVSFLIMGIMLLGMIIDIIILPMILTGRFDIRCLSPPQAKWNIWDVCKVVILFLFFGYMLILSETFLSRIFPVFKTDNFRMMVNSSILDALAAVFIIYFTVIQHKEPLAALGISARNFLKNVFYGVIGYIALIPVLILMLVIIAGLINITKYAPERQPVVELFLKEKGAAFLTYSSLFAAIIGPVTEELFFRGFLYSALKKYIGIFWAMTATAGLFAALHAHIVGFFPIMALGMLLAYIYEKTGTLVSSVTVHMIHNLSMVVLVFLVKQIGII